MPLSLHGGSGVADIDLRRLISSGIKKINVNAEIRWAQVEKLRDTIEQVCNGAQTLALQELLVGAAHFAVEAKLALLSRQD